MKRLKDREIKLDYTFSLFSLLRRLGGIVIIIILGGLWMNSRNDYLELEQLNVSLSDSLVTTKNEKGELQSKISSLETRNVETFLAFKTKDSLTLELQKEVKSMKRYLKKRGSVSTFGTSTDVSALAQTEVEENPETGSLTYRSNFDLGGWVFGKTVATKDSTYLDLKVKNQYSLVVGIEPTGFLGLGKGKPFSQITNKNPYSQTETLKTYNVTGAEDKKFVIGPSVGVGIDGKPFFGATLTYSLYKFNF